MIARQFKALKVHAAARMCFGRADAAHLAPPACDVQEKQHEGMPHAPVAVHPQQGGEACTHKVAHRQSWNVQESSTMENHSFRLLVNCLHLKRAHISEGIIHQLQL